MTLKFLDGFLSISSHTYDALFTHTRIDMVLFLSIYYGLDVVERELDETLGCNKLDYEL